MPSRHLSEVLHLFHHDAELRDANILRFSFDMASIGDIHACLFYDADDIERYKFECGDNMLPRHLPAERNEVQKWASACERDRDYYFDRKYDIRERWRICIYVLSQESLLPSVDRYIHTVGWVGISEK